MAHLPEVEACIDRFEAVVEGEGDARTAEPADGRLPTTAISWFDARRACANAGYRLCDADEWTQACAGATDPEADGARVYPYGDEFELDRCNSAADGSDVSERALAPGGRFERCVTPEGVHDLSGNLGEWLETPDASGHTRELRGGSYANYERAAKCWAGRPDYQPPDVEFDGMGFRCCTDANR